MPREDGYADLGGRDSQPVSDSSMVTASDPSSGGYGGSQGGSYVQAAGGGMMGLGSILEGMAKSEAMEFQADVNSQNANEALEAGGFNASKFQRRSAVVLGNVKSNYAASGVNAGFGSAAAVVAASASQAELDRLNILHGADIKAANYQNQAQLDRYGARNALKSGALGGIAGLVTAGGSLAGLA